MCEEMCLVNSLVNTHFHLSLQADDVSSYVSTSVFVVGCGDKSTSCGQRFCYSNLAAESVASAGVIDFAVDILKFSHSILIHYNTS